MLKYAIFLTEKQYTDAFDYNINVTLKHHIDQVVNEMATPDCFSLFDNLKDAMKEASSFCNNHACAVVDLHRGREIANFEYGENL